MFAKGGKQPRDDYREFLELTALFLGEIPPGENDLICLVPFTMLVGCQKSSTVTKYTCLENSLN